MTPTTGRPFRRLLCLLLAGILGVALGSVGVAPAVATTVATFTNPAPIEGRSAVDGHLNSDPITLSASGTPTGSVYPSTTTLSGIPGNTTYLEVDLTIQHTAPDDLDVLLVAPNGKAVVLMSDAGGYTDFAGIVNFDSNSVMSLPDTTGFGHYGYAATNWVGNDVAGDVWPAPAPAVPDPNASLSTLLGDSPNGDWKLYVRDDQDQDGGVISAWTITVTTDAWPTPAATYPSTIPVSGLSGAITDVDLTLKGVSWYYSYDLDVMLVSPDGRRAVVLSDVQAPDGIVDAHLVLDDDASGDVPPADPITSGRYRPTNLGAGDTFPSPAPDASGADTSLSVFDGGDANGSWSLYVVQDYPDYQSGVIAGGWSLTITTNATSTAPVPSQTVPRITSTAPKARATGVRRGANIAAVASKALLPGSVTGRTVYLTRAGSSRHVAATIRYLDSTHTILIDPRRRLAAGTRYRVVVSTGVRDTTGHRLDQDPTRAGLQAKTWRFRTRG